MSKPSLEERVSALIGNATEGGYDPFKEHPKDEDLAQELVDYTDSFDDCGLPAVTAAVAEVRKRAKEAANG